MAKTKYTEKDLTNVKTLLKESRAVPESIEENTLNDYASMVMSVLGPPPCPLYGNFCESCPPPTEIGLGSRVMENYKNHAIGLLVWSKEMLSLKGL